MTINEPCTQYDITYASNFGTITTTVGTSTTSTISFPSSGKDSYSTECALTYTLDAAGICSFCSLNTSGDLTITVNPSDSPVNVGTYYIEMTTCYSYYEE